ncbi:class A beta-lactamase-related serine hydrolase [Streptomyces sp. NBC_00631]
MAAGAGSGPADFRTAVQAQGQARVTAAVLDLDGTGREPTVHGDDTPYDTASIVKVDILAAMLLHARDHRRDLTARESAQAEVMIRDSDNTAASALWRAIGKAPGLESANRRLGLTSTQGGPGGLWGLTRTTATDQIRLLRAIFGTGPTPLDAASRSRIGTLMTEIAAGQSWGVSAAADAGWALKNGWLMRTTTGLWDINSIGRVTAGGHHYLVAVLSDGNASMPDGVNLVERAVRTAVSESAAH